MGFSADDLLNIPTMGGYAVGKKVLTGNWTGGGPSIGMPGNNDYVSPNYGDSPFYNPNDFNYGGTPGGADKAAGIYGNVANNYTQGAYGNFTAAAGFLDQSQGARGQQEEALGLMRDRAMGNNLISQKVAEQQRQKMLLQQQSVASSARGPAGLALAQQQRAASSAAGEADIATGAEIAGAQEQLANEQAYFGGASTVRGGDFTGAGTAFTGGGIQGGLGAQYAGLESRVRESQLNAAGQRQQVLSGASNAQQQRAADTSQKNAENTRYWIDKGLTAAQGAIPTPGGTGSDERMKSGIFGLGGGDSANGMVVKSGGLDVGASLRATNAIDTQFLHHPGGSATSNPTGGMMAGGMMSDPRAKSGVQDADKHMTGLLASGLEPFRYEYKPGFGKPGPNVGPMAQNMMANPVTGVAVETDPNTGLFTLDRDKLMKLTAGGVGHLAAQVQRLEQLTDAALAATRPGPNGMLRRAA